MTSLSLLVMERSNVISLSLLTKTDQAGQIPWQWPSLLQLHYWVCVCVTEGERKRNGGRKIKGDWGGGGGDFYSDSRSSPRL